MALSERDEESVLENFLCPVETLLKPFIITGWVIKIEVNFASYKQKSCVGRAERGNVEVAVISVFCFVLFFTKRTEEGNVFDKINRSDIVTRISSVCVVLVNVPHFLFGVAVIFLAVLEFAVSVQRFCISEKCRTLSLDTTSRLCFFNVVSSTLGFRDKHAFWYFRFKSVLIYFTGLETLSFGGVLFRRNADGYGSDFSLQPVCYQILGNRQTSIVSLSGCPGNF